MNLNDETPNLRALIKWWLTHPRETLACMAMGALLGAILFFP